MAVSISSSPWTRWWHRRIWRKHPVDKALWRHVMKDLPLFDRLTSDEQHRLHGLVSVFLHEKSFAPVKGARVEEHFKVQVAAQACLPILELGISWYRGWSSIILYPDQFVAPHHAVDTSGVHHEWHEALSGQAWQRGPVVLSMADIEASGRLHGFNVIIHEMAHQIDMLSEGPNGCPPLHPDMDRATWHRELSAAYDYLNACLDRGLATALDPYAGSSPGEFFAVCSEMFFERPEELHEDYPGVYRALESFYRQHPIGKKGCS